MQKPIPIDWNPEGTDWLETPRPDPESWTVGAAVYCRPPWWHFWEAYWHRQDVASVLREYQELGYPRDWFKAVKVPGQTLIVRRVDIWNLR